MTAIHGTHLGTIRPTILGTTLGIMIHGTIAAGDGLGTGAITIRGTTDGTIPIPIMAGTTIIIPTTEDGGDALTATETVQERLTVTATPPVEAFQAPWQAGHRDSIMPTTAA